MTVELTYGAMPDLLMGTGVALRIEADPLGPVNQIVRLVCHHRGGLHPIKAALWPIREGSTVSLVHENANSWREGPGWRMLCGYPDPEPDPGRPSGWYVEIDGHTALYASDSEIWPPTPAGPVPWRVRTHRAVKSWLRTRARAAGDRIAARFGYAHGDEAGDRR